MRLFDTHAHLDDKQLRERLPVWLQTASQSGVIAINTIGTDLESSRKGVALARLQPMVYASVGIHPNYCQHAQPDQWPDICRLAEDPRVIGIGETGLDRYWDYCPLDVQKEWFAKHIELSYQVQKPLIIHMRDCEADVVEVLASKIQDQHICGILHSFAATWETARRCLEWGMYISFSGIVTYKKSADLREIAARIPLDRILVETDSPYLPPEPVRNSRPNHPALVQHTATCLANIFQMELAEFAEQTTKNACSVFQIAENDLP